VALAEAPAGQSLLLADCSDSAAEAGGGRRPAADVVVAAAGRGKSRGFQTGEPTKETKRKVSKQVTKEALAVSPAIRSYDNFRTDSKSRQNVEVNS
jgi:hypothetical protein